MTPRVLTSVQADAIADRVTLAVRGLGLQPHSLHLEDTRAGLLVQVGLGDRTGSCLIPHGRTVTWSAVAETLMNDAAAYVAAEQDA